MEKYLIFEDETSKKFWHVRVEGNNVVVTFGRIGTAGQSQAKAYPTAADAEKEASKQAASKQKKGYVEAEIPENTPAAAGSTATPTAKAPAQKAAPKSGNGPTDVADDGEKKPWHGEDFWEYSWYYPENETIFNHLEEVRDEPRWDKEDSAKPVKQSAATTAPDALDEDEDIEFDEDDDENDRRKKREKARIAKMTPEQFLESMRNTSRELLTMRRKEFTDETVEEFTKERALEVIEDKAEWRHSYRECDPYIKVLRLLIPDEAEFKKAMKRALKEGMEDLIDCSSYMSEDEKAHLQWLLENGASFSGEGKVELKVIKEFIAAYRKNPDPARVIEMLNECGVKLVAEFAQQYAEGFRELVNEFASGKVNEGVWPADATHFVIKADGIKPYNGKFWKRFEFNIGLYESAFAAELVKTLPALLQKMAEAGDFDALKERGLPIVVAKSESGELYLRHILDQAAFDAQGVSLESLIADLENRTDFKDTKEALKQAVEALMEGIYMPVDLERARALLQKYLYSCDGDAQDAAKELYNSYADLYHILKHDRAIWMHRNGNYSYAITLMEHAAKGYAPATERLAEFIADGVRRAEMAARYKSGEASASTKKTKIGRDNFHQVFSEDDLLLSTERVIARAYADGHIVIRFRIEGEQAYCEVLDWLNNLLEKDYADLNRGYQISVRFLIKPIFIKALASATHEEGYGFAKTTCHAFFARAVEYPALREKVKRYAELALRLYYWYTDLDGEENCVPGTFAACALAFADEKYVPMIGRFGRHSDDEHQYIQLLVAAPLFKQYGATPEVAAALYDIQSSNGQSGDIRLNKALLTTPACLTGVMNHVAAEQAGEIEANWEPHHLEYHIPGYVEAIWGSNVKSNLKKFKQFADGATNDEDKNAFVDFYNFYKEYATLRDKEDYGEDLMGVAEAKKNIVVPVYDTEPLISVAQADKEGLVYESNNDDYAEKRAVVFYPSSIDDPELMDHLLSQWNAGSAAYRAGARMTFYSIDEDTGADAYGKWVFIGNQVVYDWGVMLTDSKNKPFVLYGVLNATPLAIRWCKRPFKTAEEAEAARQSVFVREAPQRIKPTNDRERELDIRLGKMFSGILSTYWWLVSELSRSFKPEDGRYYDSALLMRAKAAIDLEELDEAAAIYDELSARRPEYASYLAQKRAELGKTSK